MVDDLTAVGSAQEQETSSSGQEYKEIVVTDDGGARTILLNRPSKKNALNYQVWPHAHLHVP